MSDENTDLVRPGDAGTSSAARVVNYIRDGIAEGVFWPNQRLVEAELAERLGVSRTPVREAIIELTRLGLVRTVRNRGAFIVPQDQREVRELAVIRSVLEGLAGRLATERISPEDIDTLESYNIEMRALVDRGDMERFLELNSKFHRLLYGNCENGNLLAMIGNLLERTYAMRMRVQLWRSKDLADRSIAEHAEVVTALRRRDPIAVENLLRRHIKALPQPTDDNEPASGDWRSIG